MRSHVFEEVEAALLNSEGEPGREIDHALQAAAKFAIIECEISVAEFLSRAEKAYRSQLMMGE